MIMALWPVICILCPDCVCVDFIMRIMEGVPASVLQSAQNVKVKFLSIIRGVSTVNYCLGYLLSEPPPPRRLRGVRLAPRFTSARRTRGVWGACPPVYKYTAYKWGPVACPRFVRLG